MKTKMLLAWICILTVSPILSCRSTVSGSNNVDSSKITIKLDLLGGEKEYLWNDPIDVLASVCNVGQEPVKVQPMLVPQYYFIKFEIRSSMGGAPTCTLPERRLLPPGRKELRPGMCLRELFHVDAMFEFLEPGDYELSATFRDELPAFGLSKYVSKSNIVRYSLRGGKEEGRSLFYERPYAVDVQL